MEWRHGHGGGGRMHMTVTRWEEGGGGCSGPPALVQSPSSLGVFPRELLGTSSLTVSVLTLTLPSVLLADL